MGFHDSFRAFSDPTRREIIQLLKPGRLTAGEIVAHFSMTPATISHHLSILRQAQLVFDHKEGKYIYYELNLTVVEEMMDWLSGLLDRKE